MVLSKDQYEKLNVFFPFGIADSIHITAYILLVVSFADQQYAIIFNHNKIFNALYNCNPVRRQVDDAVACIIRDRF